MIQKSAFKAYDIRGKYPEEVNEDLAYQLAHAFVVFYQAQKVIIGRDIRLTSQGLVDSLIEGFNDACHCEMGLVSSSARRRLGHFQGYFRVLNESA